MRPLYPIAQARGRVEDLAPHRLREDTGAGVLLARMIRAEKPPSLGERVVHPVAELRLGLYVEEPEPAPRAQERVESDPPERHAHADARECPHLANQVFTAPVRLDGERAVPGWGAPEGRRDVGASQLQSVVARDRIGAARDPLAMELSEEPVPRLVAREDAPRPVPAVRRGREPDDQKPRPGVPEAGYGPSPVDLVAEGGPFRPGDFHAVGAKTRASLARDHVRGNTSERVRP